MAQLSTHAWYAEPGLDGHCWMQLFIVPPGHVGGGGGGDGGEGPPQFCPQAATHFWNAAGGLAGHRLMHAWSDPPGHGVGGPGGEGGPGGPGGEGGDGPVDSPSAVMTAGSPHVKLVRFLKPKCAEKSEPSTKSKTGRVSKRAYEKAKRHTRARK